MAIEQHLDVSADALALIVALASQHVPGAAVWAYGSRVKGTARRNSDLDMVVFASPEQVAGVHALREAFEESDLPFVVDLHVWDDVPDAFRTQIKEHYVVIPPCASSLA
jgi:predicted nucleotidyltransferase